MLDNNVDYKLKSSVRRTPAGGIEGSSKRSIHVELYTDLFSSERFLEVLFPALIVFSGLKIDTKRSMALQEFSIHYARRDIQYSGEMEIAKVSLLNISHL